MPGSNVLESSEGENAAEMFQEAVADSKQAALHSEDDVSPRRGISSPSVNRVSEQQDDAVAQKIETGCVGDVTSVPVDPGEVISWLAICREGRFPAVATPVVQVDPQDTTLSVGIAPA